MVAPAARNAKWLCTPNLCIKVLVRFGVIWGRIIPFSLLPLSTTFSHGVRRKTPDSRALSRPFRRPKLNIPGPEPDPKMDSFELNKILGAILGTCLVLLVTSFAAGAIFSPAKPEKPAFEIAVKEEAAGGEKAARRACRADRETASDRFGPEG